MLNGNYEKIDDSLEIIFGSLIENEIEFGVARVSKYF